jgi:hypothetical protein
MATSPGTSTATSMVAVVATEKMAAATMISEYYIVLEDGKKKCKLVMILTKQKFMAQLHQVIIFSSI